MKTKTRGKFAGMAFAAALGTMALLPGANAIPLVWLTGPDAGQAFTGGAISIKALNFDTGTFYTGTSVGSSIGFGAGGASGSVGAGETALNGNSARAVLGPNGPGYGSASGEDGWGIFQITDIMAEASDGVLRPIFNYISSPFELTGVFWGIRDFYLHQASPGSGSAFAGQIIDGTNMNVDFYMDDTKNFSQTGGPGVRIDENGYPTVTDGDLVLSLRSTGGFINDTGTYGGTATEFESNTASVGYAALDVVGGDAETVSQFNTNGIGFGGSNGSKFVSGKLASSTDVWFSFTSTQGSNGWDVNSNDPMLANINTRQVPDAGSSLALFACALPVLALLRRRRAA